MIASLRRFLWIVVAGCLFVSGCKPAATTATGAVQLPAVVLKTPDDAARSALLTIQAIVQAAGRRDTATFDRAEEQLLDDIAARDAVIGRFSSAMLQLSSRERLLREVVESWPRALAHYAERFDFDQASSIINGDQTAHVYVEAHGARDSTWVDVQCVRAGDEWRVLAVGYAPKEARAPASRPGG